MEKGSMNYLNTQFNTVVREKPAQARAGAGAGIAA
jgi:hypothetical protein